MNAIDTTIVIPDDLKILVSILAVMVLLSLVLWDHILQAIARVLWHFNGLGP